MKVQDIMTRAPACCFPKDAIYVAAELMSRFDVGIVPVTEKISQHAKLVGVVTDRDLCLKVLVPGKDPGSVTVDDCMSRELTICTPAERVDLVLKRMGRAKVRRLPVVDRNYEVVGILSLDDIVRMKAAKDSEICKALAAISSPARAARVARKAAA
ncbi:MAG: CBS domain-containing protein [Acidobacteriia bacterium]|nr:CBS domain-containing protein [Terriglobia bacterium]